MAKYVLLEFNNDEEADGFTGMIVGASVTGSLTIKAVFKKPTQFCECVVKSDKSVRGRKWGWWVHKECGRPKRGIWQHPRNLLDPIDLNPKERRLYLGIVEGGPPYGQDRTSVQAVRGDH